MVCHVHSPPVSKSTVRRGIVVRNTVLTSRGIAYDKYRQLFVGHGNIRPQITHRPAIFISECRGCEAFCFAGVSGFQSINRNADFCQMLRCRIIIGRNVGAGIRSAARHRPDHAPTGSAFCAITLQDILAAVVFLFRRFNRSKGKSCAFAFDDAQAVNNKSDF